MTQKAVYFEKNVFQFDLQQCLSPTPTVSNEVIKARTLNGNAYETLREAVEGELNLLKTKIAGGAYFKGNVSTAAELTSDYTGDEGDYFYCIADGLYYAWTSGEWVIFADATKIANGSVTPQKTSFIEVGKYPNLVTDNTVIRGAELNNVGSYDVSEGYDILVHGVPVEGNKTYSFSIDGANVYIVKLVFKTVDNLEMDSSTLIGTQVNSAFDSVVAPQGAKFMFISMPTWGGDIANLVVQESETPQPVSDEIALSPKISVPHCVRSNLYGKVMMTLGDSLSEGGYWQEYVQKATGVKKIVNLAVGGAKINEFADGVTLENIADVDVVFVMGFFNSANSVSGTVNDLPSNAENASVCAGYKYVVEKLYSLKPSVKIVLASPHRPQANDAGEKAKAVGMVASYYGIPFIDLYNTAGFNDYTYSLYLRDSVHSSFGEGGGYEQEARVIAGGLVKYFG